MPMGFVFLVAKLKTGIKQQKNVFVNQTLSTLVELVLPVQLFQL
jgi:hypothetical protein